MVLKNKKKMFLFPALAMTALLVSRAWLSQYEEQRPMECTQTVAFLNTLLVDPNATLDRVFLRFPTQPADLSQVEYNRLIASARQLIEQIALPRFDQFPLALAIASHDRVVRFNVLAASTMSNATHDAGGKIGITSSIWRTPVQCTPGAELGATCCFHQDTVFETRHHEVRLLEQSECAEASSAEEKVGNCGIAKFILPPATTSVDDQMRLYVQHQQTITTDMEDCLERQVGLDQLPMEILITAPGNNNNDVHYLFSRKVRFTYGLSGKTGKMEAVPIGQPVYWAERVRVRYEHIDCLPNPNSTNGWVRCCYPQTLSHQPRLSDLYDVF